jgi:lactoylglutathione lyase
VKTKFASLLIVVLLSPAFALAQSSPATQSPKAGTPPAKSAHRTPKAPAKPGPVQNLLFMDHVGINITDLQRSADFYERVLGFKIFHKWTTTWMVKRGRMKIGLFLRPQGTPIANIDQTIAITHWAYNTDARGFKAAQKALTALGVTFTPPEDTGIAYAIFFNDPDGHQLEITTFHKPTPPAPPTPTPAPTPQPNK